MKVSRGLLDSENPGKDGKAMKRGSLPYLTDSQKYSSARFRMQEQPHVSELSTVYPLAAPSLFFPF